MPTSYPSRFKPLLASGLALALVAGAVAAHATERAASPAPSHSTRDIGRPASTGLEVAPPGKAVTGDQVTQGRGAPAVVHPPAATRSKGTERGIINRLFRRANDGRVIPPAPLEEPRRGGVGTLIGITLA